MSKRKAIFDLLPQKLIVITGELGKRRKNMKKLWLDMDGVISGFNEGVCKYFNIPFSYEPYTFPLGLWDWIKWFENEYDLPWTAVEHVCSNPKFWKNLPVIPSAITFYKKLIQYFDVRFLTAPTGDYNANFDGKRAWLEQHGFAIPRDKRMILLEPGESKEDHAAPGIILIDDQDANVQKFWHGGGYAVLAPRPWNNRHREFKSFEEANGLVLTELLEIK